MFSVGLSLNVVCKHHDLLVSTTIIISIITTLAIGCTTAGLMKALKLGCLRAPLASSTRNSLVTYWGCCLSLFRS